MIQTEQNFNSSPTSARSNSNIGAVETAMTRTRCPGCKKLFAVATETLDAMSASGLRVAEFACTGDLCHEAFAIELPLPLGHAKLGVLPAIPLSRNFLELEPQPEVQIDEARPTKPMPDTLVGAVAAPLRIKVNSVSERECPRCGAANVATSTDCARCGIVFERIHDDRIDDEVALGGTRELSLLWDKTLEDYEDRIRHDRFLNAARDAGALSYASKKYSQILIAVPQDDIARLMRNRIVAMISIRAESSKMPIRLNFRIPKINSMALFGGSVLFFWGLMMPQLKNIMEIGLSLVLLAIGVRVALRVRI